MAAQWRCEPANDDGVYEFDCPGSKGPSVVRVSYFSELIPKGVIRWRLTRNQTRDGACLMSKFKNHRPTQGLNFVEFKCDFRFTLYYGPRYFRIRRLHWHQWDTSEQSFRILAAKVMPLELDE